VGRLFLILSLLVSIPFFLISGVDSLSGGLIHVLIDGEFDDELNGWFKSGGH
jgi:hypothetical protein